MKFNPFKLKIMKNKLSNIPSYLIKDIPVLNWNSHM